ncbi:cell wall protein DAN4 [Drosophila santomea]|uniref:cell wall protein DAN4 n=1 Tax=Drosophila santomea TaxID=129105 RepID=UPI0019537F3D|nr:cell wall protein DAN4 [Drosophila santomea]
MNLLIAIILLIFMVAAFAADSPLSPVKGFVDFEDIDDVAKTESKGVTYVPIITAAPISITTTGFTSKSTSDGLSTTISTTGTPASTHSSTSAITTDSNISHSTTNDPNTDESTTTDSATEFSTTTQASTRVPETTVFTTSSSETTESRTFPSTTDSATPSSTTTQSTPSPSTTDSTTNDSTTTETTSVPTTSSPPDSTTDFSLTSSSSTDSTTSDFMPKETTTSASTTNSGTSAATSTTTDSSPNTSDFTTTESSTEFSTATTSTSINTSTPSLSTTASTTLRSTTDNTTTSDSTEDTTTTTTESTTTTEQPTEEERILALLAQNSEALALSNTQLDAVSTINWKIDAELDNQAEYLDIIEATEGFIHKQSQELLPWEAKLLRGVVTSIQKIDLFANRSIETVSDLVRLQKVNQDRVRNLGVKLNATQGQILRSTKRLDGRLNFVNQLLLGYIVPKVNSLRDSVANLNISQVNSQIELKNVPEVRNLTKTSITKLSALNNHLALFNQTQENRFYPLEATIKAWTPTNFNAINELAQALSISQKRTDLAIAISGSPKYNSNTYPTHFVSYNDVKDINPRGNTRTTQILGGEYKPVDASWNVVAPA